MFSMAVLVALDKAVCLNTVNEARCQYLSELSVWVEQETGYEERRRAEPNEEDTAMRFNLYFYCTVSHTP